MGTNAAGEPEGIQSPGKNPTEPYKGKMFVMIPPVPQYGMYHDDHNYKEAGTKGEDRNPRKALQEWIDAAKLIERAGGTVIVMPPHIFSDLGISDAVFSANHAYLFETTNDRNETIPLIYAATMKYPIRSGERHLLQMFWEKTIAPLLGKDKDQLRFDYMGKKEGESYDIWEGQADISRPMPDGTVILTHGIRTTKQANNRIKELFPPATPFLDMQLVGDFFHGDTAINVAQNTRGEYFVLYCPEAFTTDSVDRLKRYASEKKIELLEISIEDAREAYVANSLEVNGSIFLLEKASPAIKQKLRDKGFNVPELNYGELFDKGGGGTRCSVLELRNIAKFQKLAQVLMDKFRFNAQEWEKLVWTYPPSTKAQHTPNLYDLRPPALRALKANQDLPTGFQTLNRIPAHGEVTTIAAQQAGLVPVDFRTSETQANYQTNGTEVAITWEGQELPIGNPRPKGVIIIRDNQAKVASLDEIQPSDEIVMRGSEGIIRMLPKGHQNSAASNDPNLIAFGFGGTIDTPEFPKAASLTYLAQLIIRMKMEGKKVALAAGPALDHQDASKFVAALIRHGLIDVLYTGNAFATHDLELNHRDFGTSLGASPELALQTGGEQRQVPEGHKHHLQLINWARQYGTLEELMAAERDGQPLIGPNSAMRAAVEKGISIVMAGSIRDDGPFSKLVFRDTLQGKKALRASLRDVGLVIDAATYFGGEAILEEVPATTAKYVIDTEKNVINRLKAVNPFNYRGLTKEAYDAMHQLCQALGVAVEHLLPPSPMGAFSRAKLENPQFYQASPYRPVVTQPVISHGRAPDGFVSSTNETTYLNLGTPEAPNWVKVNHQKMDGPFVLNRQTDEVTVKAFDHLEIGDEVVVSQAPNGAIALTEETELLEIDGIGGEVIVTDDGIARIPLTKEYTPKTMEDVAMKLLALRRQGKGVYAVFGDAVIQSGAGPYIAELIRHGLITRIHAGQSVPMYEVESALFKTRNQNDLAAINHINALGGLNRETFQKLAPGGIMHAAYEKGAPVSITNSPNDTDFMVGAINGSQAAQDSIRQGFEGVEFWGIFGSVLHGIAAGNLAPGEIPAIAVDHSDGSLNKTADRGSVQVGRFKKDVSKFFGELREHLARLSPEEFKPLPGESGTLDVQPTISLPAAQPGQSIDHSPTAQASASPRNATEFSPFTFVGSNRMNLFGLPSSYQPGSPQIIYMRAAVGAETVTVPSPKAKLQLAPPSSPHQLRRAGRTRRTTGSTPRRAARSTLAAQARTRRRSVLRSGVFRRSALRTGLARR